MKIVLSAPVFGRVAGLVVAVCAGAASASPYLNLESATRDTKAVLASGGQADIVLFGDSLAFHDLYSFRQYFTDDLQAVYGNAGKGYAGLAPERGRFGAGWTAGVVHPADPAPHHALDGLWLKAMGGGPTPSSGVITAQWDRMELHYIAEPGGGGLQLTGDYDGIPYGRIDTNAAARQVRTYNLSFPPGTASAVRFAPDGTGPVTLLGMNLGSDDPGVRVHRASNGGWGIDHYLRRDWTFDEQLDLLGTDLTMVALGANDAGTPRDVYEQKLGLFIDRLQAARPDGEIILVSPYQLNLSGIGELAAAMEQVAAARGVGFINLYETAGDYDFFVRNGFLNDGIHFTEAGGEYVGKILSDAFITNGASLDAIVPEPSAAALALAGAAVALRRGRRRK